MLTAFSRALEDTFQPEQRRAILASVVLALALLVALWLGAAALLDHASATGVAWLDTAIAVIGSAGALVLAWLLFPAMTMLFLGFFLDGLVAAVERRRYPSLPAPRRVGIGEGLKSALRILLLALLINIAALPFYLVPAINVFIYYGLNGYLVGREYFELVALRWVDGAAARALWRRHRGRLVLAGVVIVFLLSLPLVNLVAPVTAVAFMLHVVEGLRRGAAAETFAGSNRSRLMKD